MVWMLVQCGCEDSYMSGHEKMHEKRRRHRWIRDSNKKSKVKVQGLQADDIGGVWRTYVCNRTLMNRHLLRLMNQICILACTPGQI